MPIPKAKYKVWDQLYGDEWLCTVIERTYQPYNKDYNIQWWWYRVLYYDPEDKDYPFDTVDEESLVK